MANEKTTFSIEIYAGAGVKANAYGVHPAEVLKEVNECLKHITVHQMFEPEGLDIQIRREDL